MESGKESVQKTVKVVKRGGFVYTIVMELSRSEPKPNNISVSSNKQRETMGNLITELRRKCANAGNPLHMLCTRGTICSTKEGRIDSQTTVANQARANLQFQIEDRTHAVTVLETFPSEAPEELRSLRIDDTTYGFTMNQILAYIQSGLYKSADTRRYHYITWRISKTYELSEENFQKHIANFAGLTVKYVAKTSGKQLAKLFVKGIAKIGGKVGGKTAAKAVPFLGLGCGVVFGACKLFQGDYVGAAAEVVSGAVSTVPGVGTAASVAIDAGIAYRDINQAYDTVEEITCFEWHADAN